MTSDEAREVFLQYFEDRGHKRVKSSSLVPQNDPTLLFTNAGMNQFKDVFLGSESRDYQRAVTSQKCMRVSGKHNDLETVGRTPRHHTFFEMLGNFSFGDYFKREAIEYAWELCTQIYRLPEERLRATVYREDDEAHELWRRHAGVREQWIYRLGKKDNFWQMGETGPCGPCSEIHYDMLESPAGHRDCEPDCSCGRYLEIWNLVFMQFDRDASGELTPLPRPSIDTGMGLERISCLVQGVTSNYDTDLFVPIIQEACRLTGVEYGKDPKSDVSLRILADHSRSCSFLIHDGVVPGNEGRGYVLRKILRRGIRHGKMLGREEPFIYRLTKVVSELMSPAYPELEDSREYAAKVVLNEEEKFSTTLSHGLQRLEELFEKASASQPPTLPGSDLFRLYDTFGFPLDLSREIAEERGFQLDEAGFYEEMEKQRQRARASWKGGEKAVSPLHQALAERGLATEFTGYETTFQVEGQVLAIVRGEQEVKQLAEGESGQLVLNRTPFYAEAGGQVGDRGTIESPEAEARVENVFSPVTGLRFHQVQMLHGTLKVGDSVHSTVSGQLRARTARNHTATHLLHAALREVLGEHVKQAGSLVAPDRLRFDFTHYASLSSGELRQIEEIVNQKIRENIALETRIQDLDEAIRGGAMALFGEKYQNQVRVVTIPGFSVELCGGTHVQRTGDIALFKIAGESSISAGVRRLEALTGQDALERFLEAQSVLDQLSEQLKTPPSQLSEAIARLSQEAKERARDLERVQLQLAQKSAGNAREQARDVKGIRVLARRVDNLDRSGLRSLADQLKNQLGTGVIVLGSTDQGKVSLVSMVSADLTDRIPAHQLIRRLAPLVNGGGGGKPELAEAGGKDAGGLDKALEESYSAVEAMIQKGP